jgi:hypothetical protein
MLKSCLLFYLYRCNFIRELLLSLYSRFYELIILEGTYAVDEGKNVKCIFRYQVAFVVGNK